MKYQLQMRDNEESPWRNITEPTEDIVEITARQFYAFGRWVLNMMGTKEEFFKVARVIDSNGEEIPYELDSEVAPDTFINRKKLH